MSHKAEKVNLTFHTFFIFRAEIGFLTTSLFENSLCFFFFRNKVDKLLSSSSCSVFSFSFQLFSYITAHFLYLLISHQIFLTSQNCCTVSPHHFFSYVLFVFSVSESAAQRRLSISLRLNETGSFLITGRILLFVRPCSEETHFTVWTCFITCGDPVRLSNKNILSLDVKVSRCKHPWKTQSGRLAARRRIEEAD